MGRTLRAPENLGQKSVKIIMIVITVTVTTPPTVVTMPPAVVFPIYRLPVSLKLSLLVADLLIVLTGFAPIALADLVITALS